jgi:hypothetical protein
VAVLGVGYPDSDKLELKLLSLLILCIAPTPELRLESLDKYDNILCIPSLLISDGVEDELVLDPCTGVT